MGAYPFILRLFALISAFDCIMVFPMLYVVKWLYGANRGIERGCYISNNINMLTRILRS